MPSRNHLLLSAAVLLAVLAAAAEAVRSPSCCVPGQAIPLRPLPGCRWYVASRTCGGVVPRLPAEAMKAMCCRQLEAVPAEFWCKALRVMMEDTSPSAGLRGQVCWHAQAEFAPRRRHGGGVRPDHHPWPPLLRRAQRRVLIKS